MTDPGRPVLRLPDTPGYPVARQVPLPEGHEHGPTGALSLRLGDLTVALDGELGEATAETLENGRTQFHYPLPPLVLSGRYSLDVKPEQQQQLDTAGDLRPLSRAEPSPGEPRQPGLPDEEREGFLDTARAQRERLVKESDNGYQLVSTFYEHNEVFNEVFQRGVEGWGGQGTQETARDTDAAVREGGLVNDPNKRYQPKSGKPELSYNGLAFTHKLALEATLTVIGQEPDRDALQPKYQKALDASGRFAKTIREQTHNAKDALHPMTAAEVHAAVQQTPALAEEFTVDPSPYLDPDAHLERITTYGGTAPGGLDEDDLRHIRSCRAQGLARLAAAEAAVGSVLHEGTCGTRITGGTITAETEQGDDGRGTAVVHVDLPDLSLELDDSAWEAEAGRTARERVARMHFVRTLLQDALAERLRTAVLDGRPELAHPDLTASES
ncbi:hypothetical protein [Streptomyces cacaoi]|uniref:hypothetical protein n=1 Tax=Streptomyces cacaoi TaxID=1898 RepID=UPI0026322A6E|nr:hypothetical protein [Streptomyces cacaoi]